MHYLIIAIREAHGCSILTHTFHIIIETFSNPSLKGSRIVFHPLSLSRYFIFMDSFSALSYMLYFLLPVAYIIIFPFHPSHSPSVNSSRLNSSSVISCSFPITLTDNSTISVSSRYGKALSMAISNVLLKL